MTPKQMDDANIFPFYQSTYNGLPVFVLSVEVSNTGDPKHKNYDLAILARDRIEATRAFLKWKEKGKRAGYGLRILPLQNSAKIPGNWKIVTPEVAPELSEQSSLFETEGT